MLPPCDRRQRLAKIGKFVPVQLQRLRLEPCQLGALHQLGRRDLSRRQYIIVNELLNRQMHAMLPRDDDEAFQCGAFVGIVRLECRNDACRARHVSVPCRIVR
jgi:hypothetical protein